MQKNVSGQIWTVFAFDRTTLIPASGDASNITAKLGKDGGAYQSTNDTNPTETENGFYEFDLTQAETNADEIIISPVSSTSNVQVLGVPSLVVPVPENWNDLGITTSGYIDRVVLNDTTTTNTDMRGTDGANTTTPPTAEEIGSGFLSTTLTKGSAGTIERAFWQILKTQAITDGTTVADASNTTSTFITDLTNPDSHFDHLLMLFTSNGLEGEARPISTYIQNSGTITLQEPLSAIPSGNEDFIILPYHVHPISEIWGYENRTLTSAANITSDSGVINSTGGTIDRVTLVDTTTANTDMRGTDGANTVVPDAAVTASGLHSTTDTLIQFAQHY